MNGAPGRRSRIGCVQNVPHEIALRPSQERRLPLASDEPGTAEPRQRHATPIAYPFDEKWVSAWAEAFLGDRGWDGPISSFATGQRAPHHSRASVTVARQRLGPVRVAAVAGYYWPSRGVAVAGMAGAELAGDELAACVARSRLGPLLRIGPIAGDDVATQGFCSGLQRRGWTQLRRTVGDTYRLELRPGIADFRQQASGSLLKNLKYSRRRLEREFGPVACQRIEVGHAELPRTLERFRQIEAQSWVSGEGGEPKFIGSRNGTFWRLLSEPEPPGSWSIVAWFLSVGEKDVAFSAHIEKPDTLWIIANSYDPAWHAHSPGSILTLSILEDASARGVKTIDWGQGDSGYKSRWGAKPTVDLSDHLFFAPSVVGRLAYQTARAVLKGWARAGT